MKKLFIILTLLLSFQAKPSFGASVKNFKATQLQNGDIRFYAEIYDTYVFYRELDSIKVRNDTVELYFCILPGVNPSTHYEYYVKDFTPSGSYSSYKGKLFFLDPRYPYICDLSDTSTVVYPFTLSLPLADTAYILEVPKAFEKTETVLFPNPTTGSVSIPGTLRYETLIVTNTFGQTVLEAKAQPTFSLAGLPAGLYFVRFLNRQGMTIGSSRIVKE